MKTYVEAHPETLARFERGKDFAERVRNTARTLRVERGRHVTMLRGILAKLGVELVVPGSAPVPAPGPPPPEPADGSAKRPLTCLSSDEEDEAGGRGATPATKKPKPAAAAAGKVCFSFGPVLQSNMDQQDMMRRWDKGRIDEKVANPPETRWTGNTFFYHMVGKVDISAGADGTYKLAANGTKTLVGGFGQLERRPRPGASGVVGPWSPPGETLVAERKRALDEHYSRNQEVPEQFKPAGGGSRFDVQDDWNCANKGTDGFWEVPRVVFDSELVPGTKAWQPLISRHGSVGPTGLRWREAKLPHGWDWSWDADLRNNDGGASAGSYLMVSDQRSQHLCTGPKLFTTEMVGMFLRIEPGSDGRAELSKLLQSDSNPSGGVNSSPREGYGKLRANGGGGAGGGGASGGAARRGKFVAFSGVGNVLGSRR